MEILGWIVAIVIGLALVVALAWRFVVWLSGERHKPKGGMTYRDEDRD